MTIRLSATEGITTPAIDVDPGSFSATTITATQSLIVGSVSPQTGFKNRITNGAELQDVGGNTMSPEQVQEFLKTLP